MFNVFVKTEDRIGGSGIVCVFTSTYNNESTLNSLTVAMPLMSCSTCNNRQAIQENP